jgi:K+-sensing histidine kinase KdpD
MSTIAALGFRSVSEQCLAHEGAIKGDSLPALSGSRSGREPVLDYACRCMPARPSTSQGQSGPRGAGAGYLFGGAVVAASTGFSSLVSRKLQLSDLVMINLLGVVAVSTRFGIGPSLFTAALTALSFDYFFIPPVFAFAPSDLESTITLGVMITVAAIISGLGERTRRQHATAQAREVQMETERLRSSLLSAVSHDLRTPLAGILGAGTELLQDGNRMNSEARTDLVRAVVEEAERLNQLITNLLDVARLDGGPSSLRKRLEPLDEVIEIALGRLAGRLRGRQVRTRVPAEVPMVPMDPMLIEQVLVNLLENALRYTPDGSALEIDVEAHSGTVIVELRDQGPGIREGESELLFQRFQRGDLPRVGDGGVGLGLTICRAILRAHGGVISIANRADLPGAVVRFSLPLGEAAPAGSAS